MGLIETLTQAGYWVELLLNSAALCAVLIWQRAIGKSWLVASLSLMVFVQLYFRILHVLVHYFSDEPRFELYHEYQAIHLVVQLSGVVATSFLVIAILKLRGHIGKAPQAKAFAQFDRLGLPNISLLPETPPDTRARILLRLGGTSDVVVQAIQSDGKSAAEAQSIVHAQLDALRGKAAVMLGCGLVLSLCALVANVISFGQYMQLQRSYGYHLVYFYPIPFLIGVAITCTGIVRLSRLR